MAAIQIKEVGILGAGTIGSSWATFFAFFAMQGMKVRMHDVDRAVEERGIVNVCANLGALVEYAYWRRRGSKTSRGTSPPRKAWRCSSTAPIISRSLRGNLRSRRRSFPR